MTSAKLFTTAAVVGLAVAAVSLRTPTGQLSAQGRAEPPIPVFTGKPPVGYARPPIYLRGGGTSPAAGTSYSPAQARDAYGFTAVTNQGEGQTIGIVDAYYDPNIESDLAVFNSTYGLLACTTSNGCFKHVVQSGNVRTDAGWALEVALDVEWAHAIAPKAKILLVAAKSNSFSDLLKAVDYAATPVAQGGGGASVVSMSFGGYEFSSQTSSDYHFNAPGVTFFASSGDSGNGVEYPAAAPGVVAVGGTTLTFNGASYVETAWAGSGGGVSKYESQPNFQLLWGIGQTAKRGVPDVAYDGDPNTGFPVYDSVNYQGRRGWWVVGGTSAGSPQWAALGAIVNSIRAANAKGPMGSGNVLLYSANVSKNTAYSNNFNDVTSGTNGNCGGYCTAAAGYDYVTGFGSPKAANIITALANQ